MKYLSSFRTTLKISRYLFRVLAVMLWSLGALLTTFYILNILNEKKSDIRQEYNTNFEQAQNYIRHSSDIIRDIKYMSENRLNHNTASSDIASGAFIKNKATPKYYPLNSEADCATLNSSRHSSLDSLSNLILYWKENFAAAYDLNRIFFIGSDTMCMVDFDIRNVPMEQESLLKSLSEHIARYREANNQDKDSPLYWVVPGVRPEIGTLYVLSPLYVGNKLEALVGTEQTIRLEDFISSGPLPIGVTLLDQNNEPVLRLATGERYASMLDDYPDTPSYFGYVDDYNYLLLKKNLLPSPLSIAYSLPVKTIIEIFKLLIFNALLLNALSAVVIFTLAWLFERKMFHPAEDNALRLEEHEQFNRKIVASAPVGISILRISDGTNILSNELAHNYINLLTNEDRERITRIICEQQANFVDVMTSNNNNLQISFVHSRYRNEDVAICVLVDVSSRVKMEESLQEMAAAAEQASQSKSMFLATVSHELRTPLYGIIGNLDLLQTKELPQGVERLVTAMNNSSGLLLKIISDILDFSKIESEQLKIEPSEFSTVEVITHITANYLPLVVKKRLGLYCFIEADVPRLMLGDAVRLQQVISNLLNNAIKFTDTGCIILQVRVRGYYLEFRVRDTGVGINSREINQLFDPFFQVGTGVQRHFQGTGLGLAICEKLVNLMDGDVEVISELGMGSIFAIRIPLYLKGVQHHVQNAVLPKSERWQGKILWLDIRNARLESYLLDLLSHFGATIQRYSNEQTLQDQVLICDYLPQINAPLSTWIQLSIEHIGLPQETRPGYWLLSTSTLLEIIPLLDHILLDQRVVEDTPLALPAPKTNLDENADLHILVVDDHPINRRLLADQLTALGYRVITANDGLDALAVLNTNSVDIVLTDVNMPNMDGYRLTHRLRELNHNFPVIGVTANALAEGKQRCIEAGMDNCLSKPVTLDTLRQMLRYYGDKVRKTR
ncbi:two-component system sensor histidine kinase RcsC [Yersinia enterocolitica]|uniref:two-component system sensor histidine kinase RcsC n=1 Tax=Yersinia enterocolitica TaxID=630 RepID=UPI00288D94DC|nr:two-component system sensor histidine kinase RcsC [Yersinia enterocolitica]EKN3829875.1 two-component system sensor histidine kinase RcsC [Yersinia enterocolitica]EKN3954224.1 two-component system sensor histidine kinase RcsC [Yersinia enterocolitica]EKN3995986.1 two-component system sensor histidine kinase RcsC [Yersinia enterocolitica]EKN4146842.1 two-component system sensor histidine kinase RcsC [Yersinia enterocolitica]